MNQLGLSLWATQNPATLLSAGTQHTTLQVRQDCRDPVAESTAHDDSNTAQSRPTALPHRHQLAILTLVTRSAHPPPPTHRPPVAEHAAWYRSDTRWCKREANALLPGGSLFLANSVGQRGKMRIIPGAV